VAAALLYGRALGYPFVYDDRVLIADNTALADWGTLGEALTHDLFHFSSTRASPYWRPVVTLSYYVDHGVSGGAPWSFHLTNLLALAAAAAGVARLASARVGAAAGLALGLLFMAHPLQVEGASNIAGRTDVLACAFGLWSMVAASGERRRDATAFLLTALACGSKEIGVFVPIAVWLMGGRWRPGAVAVGLFLAARAGVLAGLELLPADQPSPSIESAAGAAALAWWYLGRLLAPTHLAPAMALESPVGLSAAAGWAGAVGAGAAALVVRTRAPLVASGLSLMLLPLLPASGLARASLRYGETFLVLPLAGGCLALAGALALRPAAHRRVAPAALLAAGIVAAAIGWGRSAEWSSERSLWEGAHDRLPSDAAIAQNLARIVVNEEPARALSLLDGVTAVEPRAAREIWEIRARAHQLQSSAPEMIDALTRAAAPDREAYWVNATLCATVAGQGAPAIRYCQWALAADDSDPSVWDAAGVALAVAGDFDGAVRHFERAVALAPGNPQLAAHLAAAREDARSAGE